VFLVDIDNTTLGKIISKDYIKVFTKILDNDILVDVYVDNLDLRVFITKECSVNNF